MLNDAKLIFLLIVVLICAEELPFLVIYIRYLTRKLKKLIAKSKRNEKSLPDILPVVQTSYVEENLQPQQLKNSAKYALKTQDRATLHPIFLKTHTKINLLT